jgi:hypothetical protein
MSIIIKNGKRKETVGNWNMSLNEKFEFGNIGINIVALSQVIGDLGSDNVFVDLGVDYGISSLCMTYESIEKNNKVYGVDTSFKRISYNLPEYENYFMIQGDSSSVGKYWNINEYGNVNLLFVDTIHVACQVLTELYFWWDNIKEGGYIVFHDTNWPEGTHDLTWHPEVKEKNIKWDRPEVAVGKFFGIQSLFTDYGNTGFIYEDEFIKVDHKPDSWGMTIIKIKNKKDFRNNIDNWDAVFQDRNTVLGYFQKESEAFVLEDIREE